MPAGQDAGGAGRTLVLCLEGPHGCGKSTLSAAFRDAGFTVLEEGFMEQPAWAAALHPQSLTMETMWVGDWVQRVMQLHHRPPAGDAAAGAPRIVIADRSPYSAVLYARRDGALLTPLIRAQLDELTVAGVRVVTALVGVDAVTHWRRVAERLRREPHRIKYSEDSREHFDRVRAKYDTFPWDARVDNSGASIARPFALLRAAAERWSAACATAGADLPPFVVAERRSGAAAAPPGAVHVCGPAAGGAGGRPAKRARASGDTTEESGSGDDGTPGPGSPTDGSPTEPPAGRSYRAGAVPPPALTVAAP